MTPDELRRALKEAKLAEQLAKRQAGEARQDQRALAAGAGVERLSDQLERARDQRDALTSQVERLRAQLEVAGIEPAMFGESAEFGSAVGGGVFSEEEVGGMSDAELRAALLRAAPGVFSEKDVGRMSAAELREELLRRGREPGGGYSEAQVKKMSEDELRDVLRRAAPNVFSEEELKRMSPAELRAEVFRRVGRGHTEEQLKRMTPDQLRDALRCGAGPGGMSEEWLKKMAADELRRESEKPLGDGAGSGRVFRLVQQWLDWGVVSGLVLLWEVGYCLIVRIGDMDEEALRDAVLRNAPVFVSHERRLSRCLQRSFDQWVCLIKLNTFSILDVSICARELYIDLKM
jgi:hypothetical protein